MTSSQQMTGRALTLAAIDGQPHPRVPVAQHNFMFCVRHCGLSMHEFRTDPLKAAQALAQTAYDFDYDCIIIDFDTCVLAEAMGCELMFPDDEPARVQTPLLESLEQIDKLRVPDPATDGRLPLWLETTRQLRKIVGDDKAIMGRGDQGPFGLLFLLRPSQALMLDLMVGDEALIHQALEICTQAGARFARAQLEAGADLTSIGDGAAGQSLISPADYAKFAQPYQKKYKDLLGGGRAALHMCGKSNQIIQGMVDTGFDVLEVDHYNDLARTIGVAQNRTSIWGNVDPALIAGGTREQVFNECRRVIEAAKALTWKYALCPGCLVNSNTPPENLAAMTQAAHEFGVYEQEPCLEKAQA